MDKLSLAKNLLNQRGETLISILVASGILGIVVLASMSVMHQQTQATKQAQQVFEANFFQNEVYTLLRSKESCNANFIGVNPTGTLTRNDLLKSVAGAVSTAYGPGAAIGNRVLQVPAAGGFELRGSPTPVPPNGTGMMTLRMRMDKRGTAAQGQLARDIGIRVTTDATGNVISCSTNYEAEKLDCLPWDQIDVGAATNATVDCPPGYRVMAGGIRYIDELESGGSYISRPEEYTAYDPITKVATSTYERWYCESTASKHSQMICGAKCCRFD